MDIKTMSVEEVEKVAPDEKNVLIDEIPFEKKDPTKVGWCYGTLFLLFWPAIVFAVVIPLFLSLPAGFTISSANSNQGQFIAQYAERILFDFDHIGPKVVGSHANENLTVQLLLNELEKIRGVMQEDLFELDVDLQVASGAYIHWTMVNMYQAVQNVVVRLRTKRSHSKSYLLINSHFDSKPGSPGSGDDGAMVVIMLETLRVLATTRQPFKNPIVFLFNGAEENPLQGSHAFITQHKWAKNCKALINLDSAGSGNSEALFQTGPNNPWLAKVYQRSVKRSFASTFAEELFQSGIVPSGTDFEIFTKFSNITGLDLAHFYNGYVYHTKFDRVNIIPRGTLQTTGDNILSMARAFANSSELRNTTLQSTGRSVFYDLLGHFVVCYTEYTGQIINTSVSLAAVALVGISIWYTAEDSAVSIGHILVLLSFTLFLHLLAWILAIVLPLIIAILFDNANNSLTWFTTKWLILGLYACPALFGLSAPTLIYLSLKSNEQLSLPYRLQLVYHAHTLILSAGCIILTFIGIRSAYFLMIPLLFQAIAIIINLLTTLNRRGYYWTIFALLSQILPFLYFAYLFNGLFSAFIPMMGRFGSTTNPDLIIALMTILATVLSAGYLILLLNIFSHPKIILLILPLATIIFVLLAQTNIGFPYRPSTNVERINLIETQRVFYEYNGSVSLNESGYYFDFQDRRKEQPIAPYVDLDDYYNVAHDCDIYMMCGLPIFNHRSAKTRRQAGWLPRDEPIQLPGKPNLTLIQRTVNASDDSVHFEFELQGPPHMSIFVQPIGDALISSWSFLTDMLIDQRQYEPPYHIYLTYGNNSSPLQFYIDLKKDEGNFDEPLMQLGISGHYVSFEYARDADTKTFLASLPSFTYVMEWPASYERYIF